MATIDLKERNQSTFQTTVHAGSTTHHEVSVDMAYAQKLTSGKMATVELVKKSFRFLLERESNNNILNQFNLSIIKHYLPEYERVISKHIT